MENTEEDIQMILTSNPLMAFSLYTNGQVQYLKRVRGMLRQALPSKDHDGTNGWVKHQEYFALFWLWALGAYEVLRTMASYPECFSENAFRRIEEAKKRAAVLRMPFAKQELRGERPKLKREFYAENSAVGHGESGLTFQIGNETYQSEQYMDEILSIFSSICIDDIRSEMPVNRPGT